MQISDLRTLLPLTPGQLSADPLLDLAPAAFGPAASALFGTAAIRITGASILAGSSNALKTIRGKSTLPLLQPNGDRRETDVWLLVTDPGGGAALSARLLWQLPADWNFKSSFPTLPPDYDVRKSDDQQKSTLAQLALQAAHFILSNNAENGFKWTAQTRQIFTFDLRPGLNFVAQWTPTGMLGLLEHTLASNATPTLFGQVVLPVGTAPLAAPSPGKYPWEITPLPPGIHLAAMLGMEAGIGQAVKFQNTAFRIYSPPSGDWWKNNPLYAPNMAYMGALNIPSAGIKPILSARKRMGVDEELMIRGAFDQGGLTLAKMADLVGLSAASPDLSKLLPKPVQDRIGNIGLKYAAVNLLKENNTYRVAYTFFLAGMPNLDWSVFAGIPGLENLLVIREIEVEVMAFSPFESARRALSGNLIGKAVLLGANMEVVVGLPDFFITAALAEEKTIPLGNFFREHVPWLSAPSTLTITEFRLTAEPGNFYAFTLGLTGAWGVVIGSKTLALQGIGLAFMKTVGSERPSGTFTASIAFFADKSSPMTLNVLLSIPESGAEGYSGSAQTGLDTAIPIGTLLGDLAKELGFGADFPAALASMSATHLAIFFNTGSSDFSFQLKGHLEVQSVPAGIVLNIRLNKKGAQYEKFFSGQITVGDRQFDLIFDSKATAQNLLLGVYQKPGGEKIPLTELLKDVLPASTVPEGLSFAVKNALLARLQSGTVKKYLFSAEMDAGINLSALGDLPIVGAQFSGKEALTLAFQPIFTSKGNEKWLKSEVKTLTDLLPAGSPPLPDDLGEGGVRLLATLRWGDFVETLALGIPATSVDNKLTAPTPAGPATAPAGQPQWVELKKNFGPLNLSRVGVSYKDGKIGVLFDGGLHIGPLEVALAGLGATYELGTKRLSVSLDGLGLQFKKDPLEISGVFLHLGDDYAGQLTIAAKSFGIAALGAFGMFNGQPSFFLYAFLNYPLGGPAFFFVEGLAVGFGYNRRLETPPITALRSFPLVAEVLGEAPAGAPVIKAGAKPDAHSMALLRAKFDSLSKYLYPQEGQYFIAAGVKFSTFKTIESFALLTIGFGQKLNFGLMGYSKLSVPVKVDNPVAMVEMVFSANFDPGEGFLKVQALLSPSSYIFSGLCKLEGGFAFYSWFSGNHAGDFVVTLGGYHPAFAVPAHYPRPAEVPRLGYGWKLSDSIFIKGQAYFALTPNAMMLGGGLEASYKSGGDDDFLKVEADFKAAADFLIYWKPFHYEATASIEVSASITLNFELFSVSADISAGANLQIWGPPFAGTADIHAKVMGYKANFTVDFGGGRLPPAALNWEEFSNAFLPIDPKQRAPGLSIQKGLVKSTGDEWVINPKELKLAISTIAPLKNPAENNLGVAVPETAEKTLPALWIGPMRKQVTTSKILLKIEKKDPKTGAWGDALVNFQITPIRKKFPQALWADADKQSASTTPNINAGLMIDASGGYLISPKKPPTASSSHDFLVGVLSFEPNPETITNGSKSASFASVQDFKAGDLSAAQTKRKALLDSLGMDVLMEVDLRPGLADTYVFTPQSTNIVVT